MKWNNVSKLERKTWYTVPPPLRPNMTKAARWCREYESNGRFYYHYTNTRWWFEFEKDAVVFALTQT